MLGIKLDKKSEMPLKRQLFLGLRDRMTGGLLQAGELLPSTREAARELGISRSTACEAYEMLLAEGLIVTRQGALAAVADNLYLETLPDAPPLPSSIQPAYAADFHTGRPDLSLFPKYLWQQMLTCAYGEMDLEEYGYTGPEGMIGLRVEIASWLFRARGLHVLPEDIFITAGATHALHLAAGLLLGENRGVLTEDPCHKGMLRILQYKGCKVIPVPVDRQGIMTDRLPENPSTGAVYVTPSHQFPLGGILPASRRTELIRYAREKDLYVIEDDYDSEFRYAGEPVAPLHALDPQRVIYIGTFSKTLFPALRIGFALLPRQLQKKWRSARTYDDVQSPPFEQAALAMLLKTRKLDRHIRKMRNVYGFRRQVMLKAAAEAFANDFIPWGDAAGLHIVLQFPGKVFHNAFHKKCLQQGIYITPVEYHCIETGCHLDQLLLGYGHLSPEEIQKGIQLLKSCMR